MELRHLRYFVAVAKAGNITHAAMELNVSQPPVSRQIRDLEEELGVVLLERGSKSVELTAAGRVFLRDAQEILAKADEAKKRALAASRPVEAEVHVAYPPSPSAKLLPLALRHFTEQEPSTRVSLHDASSGEMLRLLLAGRVDLAIMVDASARAARAVQFQPLLEIEVGLLVPAGHPLARLRSCARDDLRHLNLVGYSAADYPEYLDWVRDSLQLKRPPQLAQECDGVSSLMNAVRSGHSVTVNTRMIAELSEKTLSFVPFDPPAHPMVLGIATLRKAASQAVESFCRCLREAAHQLSSTAPVATPSIRKAVRKSPSAATRAKAKPSR